SAPDGYYPRGYSGDTWTGEVVSTDDTTREITLTYTNKNKSETFTGILIENYQEKTKDGSMKELKPSGIPNAAHITVFHKPKTKHAGRNQANHEEYFKVSSGN